MKNRVYFTECQEDRLNLARGRARRDGSMAEVPGFERMQPRRLDGVEKRLALLEKLGKAIQNLCTDVELNGRMPASGEERTAREVVEQLHDVFGVIATEKKRRSVR